MSDWNSEQYLKFKKQRTQPSIDLISRLKGYDFKRIADIGCGPGNSTAVIKEAFPEASVIGIDKSPNMIEKAEKSYADIEFRLCDVNDIDSGYDLLFSNACLQWIPDHDKLIPGLMNRLNEGGVLAVQIPMNENEQLFQIIRNMTECSKWNFEDKQIDKLDTLTTDEYYNILLSCSESFDMWETVYYHSMPTAQDMVEWVRGSKLRPYLDVLSRKMAEEFEDELAELIAKTYPKMNNGDRILRFRRLFFVAYK